MGELWLQKVELSKAQYYQNEVIDHRWTTKWLYRKYQVRSRRLQNNIYAAQGKFDEAQTELQQELKLAEQLGNPGIVFISHGSATDLAPEIIQWFADDTRYVLK